MKYLWYKIVRFYVKLGLRSYFKKTIVVGKENIPKNQPVLFIGNHRNGLIDPIMIATTSSRIHLFLTRASAFKNPIVDSLLRSINMIPIYRIRDGKDSIAKNQEIFDACHREFNNNGSVLIFPEGNHGAPRRVRNLTKGFARITFGYLEKYPESDIQIVPVGLNYSNFQVKASSIALYYGKPISASNYYNPKNENLSIESLKKRVSEDLKKLTTHIEDLGNHDRIEHVLNEKGIDFLNPISANKMLSKNNNWDIKTSKKKYKRSLPNLILHWLFTINTLIPIFIWNKIKSKFKDNVMVPTIRFGLSLALIPLYYLLQSLLVGYFFNYKWAIIYFIGSILLLLLYKNRIYTDSFTTKPS
jgi:1-acyl-sn-glycerol-3-phosphate acyltransferase